MNNTIRAIAITMCMFGAACGPAAWCAETGAAGDSNVSQLIVGKFGLGVAAGVYRFTSSYRLKVEDQVPIFIDGEGTLGLEETTAIPILYGTWNIAGRHGIGFRYFRIDREGSDLAIDKQLGSLSINGILTAHDQSSFYQLNYYYAFQSNENLLLRGMIGLYTLDLKFRFDATGEIRVDDTPVASGTYSKKVEQWAPLPMLGLEFWARTGKRWALGSRITLVGGEVNDINGFVVEANLNARYKLAKHLGLIFGVNYFNGDLDIKDTEQDQTIKYGYDGVYLGLDFNF
jgi:hypothetical protein